MDELIFGIHAVKSALNYCSDSKSAADAGSDKGESPVSVLFVDRGRKDKRINAIVELAKKKSVKVTFVQRKKLDELTGANHQGVVAQSRAPKVKSESFLDELLQQLQVPPFCWCLTGFRIHIISVPVCVLQMLPGYTQSLYPKIEPYH